MSYHILDNAHPSPEGLVEWLKQPSITSIWIPLEEIPLVFGPLIKNAEKLFDLSATKGFEFWTHHHTRPDWHFDKDEEAFKAQRRLFMPLCSMVYYAHVENLFGGELYFKDGTRLLPQNNRQVVFSPGLFHRVSAYHGTRTTMLLNPWAEKPQAVHENKELLKELQNL